MDSALFWRSLAVQSVTVVILFGGLLALPLPGDFFESYGILVGPLAWAGGAYVTARILSLPLGFALFAALAGGVAGVIVLLAASHWAGMAAALLVFGASCSGHEAEGDTAPA